jgi:PAS domain S-box-containing protein
MDTQTAGKVRQPGERLFRLVADNAQEAIALIDKDGRLLYLNISTAKLLRGVPDDFIGRRIKVVLPQKSADECLKLIREVIASGREFQTESVFQVFDETHRFRSVMHPVPGENGQCDRVLCIATDLTDSQSGEQNFRRQFDLISALRQIGSAIAASLDIHVNLGIILDQVLVHLGVDAADILLYNPVTAAFELAVRRGHSVDSLRSTHHMIIENYARQAAIERHVIRGPDLFIPQENAEGDTDHGEDGFVSYFAIPLIARSEVKGVMEIFNHARFEPDDERILFLETLAVEAASSIDNAALSRSLDQARLELSMAYDTTLETLSRALELRDRDPAGCTHRMADLTLRLAASLGVAQGETGHIRRGVLLHNIGKLGIPEEILNKEGALTETEWDIVRRHPVIAYDLLSSIDFLKPALDIPYCHHERWDGTGYPRGLKGEEIPLAARLFAIVDVWEALISDRPYRPAWTRQKTLDYLRDQSGKRFDPRVTEAFIRLITTAEL